MIMIENPTKQWLLAIMLSIAMPAWSKNIDPPPPQRVAQYAQALNKILPIRQQSAVRAQHMSPKGRPMLRDKTKIATNKVLRRYNFTPATFNKMTAAIERNPNLKRQVRQQIMRARIGF